MVASNNSDTARYTNRNIFPVSLKMAVLTSSKNESEVWIFISLCKRFKNI